MRNGKIKSIVMDSIANFVMHRKKRHEVLSFRWDMITYTAKFA